MRNVGDGDEAAREVLAVEAPGERLVVVLEPVRPDVARMVKACAHVFAEPARPLPATEGVVFKRRSTDFESRGVIGGEDDPVGGDGAAPDAAERPVDLHGTVHWFARRRRDVR